MEVSIFLKEKLKHRKRVKESYMQELYILDDFNVNMHQNNKYMAQEDNTIS